MRRAAVLVSAVLTALWLPAGAAAQQLAPAIGDFGGGNVYTLPASPLAGGQMVIGLHAGDATSVQLSATVVGACASGSFSASVTLAADGTFAATGDVRQAGVRTRYELRGTLTALPSGTAIARFERRTARGMRRCATGEVPWQARRPLLGPGLPAAPVPGTTLLGTTAQLHGAAPRGIALRIAADGRTVSRALYGVGLRCSGTGTSPTFDEPRDELAIGPDGSVSDVESGTVVRGSTIQRYVERFTGVVGSTGAAGTFSVELSVRSRSSGKRITRCRSGEVAWSATP